MLKKIELCLLSLAVLLLAACSVDSTAGSDDAKGAKGIARYTVILYGQNGGDMEQSIEGTMHDIKDVVGDEDDVRVLVVYKYGGGKKFSGKLAYPGQLLFFELTKNTDLTALKDSSAIVKGTVKFYDPDYIASVINYAHDSLPAQEYLFFLEAHGEGFSFEDDFPKSRRGESAALAKRSVSWALMQDEWIPFGANGNELMTLSELAEGIKKSKVPHFKSILFHNCLMGNMESVAEIYPYADYVMVSEHSLRSVRGELMTGVVEALTNNADDSFEDIVKGTLEDKEIKVSWKQGYAVANENGDFQLIKANMVADLNPIFKKLSSRLIELYDDETMRQAIDRAADRTYKPDAAFDLFDARDYAKKFAEETGDESLEKIAKELSDAFDAMTVTHAMEAHFSEKAPMDNYSLSIVLVDSAFYNGEMLSLEKKNRESYEQTVFHKETGWGDWLNVNAHMPAGNPHGQNSFGF